MEETTVWNALADTFNVDAFSEWLQSFDMLSMIFFGCGVLLFYFVMSMALRIMSMLFWPTVVIIGLLFFRNESFAALVMETAKRASDAAMREILPVPPS